MLTANSSKSSRCFDLVCCAVCFSKESRMNGQYQQTVDPFNNDNK